MWLELHSETRLRELFQTLNRGGGTLTLAEGSILPLRSVLRRKVAIWS
jgi:hypothetical protein